MNNNNNNKSENFHFFYERTRILYTHSWYAHTYFSFYTSLSVSHFHFIQLNVLFNFSFFNVRFSFICMLRRKCRSEQVCLQQIVYTDGTKEVKKNKINKIAAFFSFTRTICIIIIVLFFFMFLHLLWIRWLFLFSFAICLNIHFPWIDFVSQNAF